MTVSEPASTETAAENDELDVRRALTGLLKLLVMSMLMLGRHDVDEVLDVLAHEVESVTRSQLVYVTFERRQKWTTSPPGHPTNSSLRPGERAFIENHGDSWTCTRAVAALSGATGQLVLKSSTMPDAEQVFVIERLGHLLGAALVDAELHKRDRRCALELDAANTEMARTVAALNHRGAVHEEFTRLAATGTELDVATSLSRRTDSTVVLRDGFAYETTRITSAGESPPVGERASLEAVIGGTPELGTIELKMRPDKEQEDETFALQYASVALGLLRAHAAAMTEMEDRLSRDLLDDLLARIPADLAADRAAAQGHDLRVPHDLIVSAWSSETGHRCHDRDVDHVRTAMAHQQLPCLVVRNQGLVVTLAHQGVDIGRLFDDLSRAYGDTNGVIAMG